jgi:serine/threonine protein kinase
MAATNNDRDLLFGLLALQTGFINRDALLEAGRAWARDKAKSLAEVLVERRALSSERHALVEALVQELLKQHGGDLGKSLAVVSARAAAAPQLKDIADSGRTRSRAEPAAAAAPPPPAAGDGKTVHTEEATRGPGGPAPAADPFATLRSAAGEGQAQPGALPSIGEYEVLGELGRGGMGVVYKARQKTLKRVVALKMILGGIHAGPEELARFHAEAQAVARVQHPNIVQIYEIGTHEGGAFLALEFVDGGSLEKRLREAPLAPRPAARLLEAVARAVHAAHQQNVIHRDLKPANILLSFSALSESGARAGPGPAPLSERPLNELTPKITDFGLAKRLDEDSQQTRTGAVMGTPCYMAPEQASGRVREIVPATDVYALGAILYEMLTGRPPFRGVSAVDTLLMVRHDEPVPPRRLQPKVPRDLETICLKCLQKDPKKRYDSALALAEDLAQFQAGAPIRARPMGRAERAWRWCRRNPVPAGLLLAVTLGGAVGMGYLTWLSDALVKYSATQGAREESKMFDQVNTYYSAQVAARANGQVEVTNHYKDRPHAIPVPATFTIELGQQISADQEAGMQVRLYSDYPFPGREDRQLDEWEVNALQYLKENPTREVADFVPYGDRFVLRYATARVMQQSCLHCHNDPDSGSPRLGWKVGDVRGVLEIIRPLDGDRAAARDGLRFGFGLLGGVFGGVLLLVTLVLVLGRRRRGAASGPAGDATAPP